MSEAIEMNDLAECEDCGEMVDPENLGEYLDRSTGYANYYCARCRVRKPWRLSERERMELPYD